MGHTDKSSQIGVKNGDHAWEPQSPELFVGSGSSGVRLAILRFGVSHKKVGPAQTLVLQEVLREEVMKTCPKCNKGMKKALQVMETEATWWEEEGFYVAKPNGNHRVYEKCLVCGTELQRNDGQTLGQTSESFDDLVIERIEVTRISEERLGHGVQFRYPGGEGIVIAFIDGFGWLHGIEKHVNVFILAVKSELWGSYTDNPQKILRTLKECVHLVLKEKGKAYYGIVKDNISWWKKWGQIFILDFSMPF